MKYKSLLNFLYFHYYTLKTKHRNLKVFTKKTFSLLGIENLQKSLYFFILKF
jgi:hypothetical protein